MSLVNIKRGLSGTAREGTTCTLKIDGDVVQQVTLQAGKYLTVEAQEYVLVTAGKKVELDVDGWHREYTVPEGRVMVVSYRYEDDPEEL